MARFATEPVARVRIPLPEPRAYVLTLRLHPLDTPGEPGQVVDVALNDRPLSTLKLEWNAERIGQYQVAVPADAVHAGLNRLTFRSHRMVPLSEGTEPFPELPPDQRVGFRLWYIHIVPQ